MNSTLSDTLRRELGDAFRDIRCVGTPSFIANGINGTFHVAFRIGVAIKNSENIVEGID